MALSLNDDYNLTRDQIIRAAFETIGVAVSNEPLEAEDVAVGKVAFNALAMSWKNYGLMLWKRGRTSLTPVASTYEITLAPTITGGSDTEKPVKMIAVNYKETATGKEIPMTRLSHKEYNNLPNKAQTGTPVQYYFEPQRTGSKMYIWPAPNATFAAGYTIEITYQSPIQSMSAGTDDVDFPSEWYRALILNLAVDLAPKYDYGIRERQLLEAQALDALDLAKNFDVEDASLYLSPDEGY